MAANQVVPESEQQIAAMFDRIAPRYDLLNKVLSGRQDVRWRKFLVEWLRPAAGGRLLDVATGTGDVIAAIIQAGRDFAEYWGVDISKEMLRCAGPKLAAIGQGKSLHFEQMSAESLKFPDAHFSATTISFGLRNVVNREAAIREFARVLRPDGQLLILEFFTPPQGLLSRLFSFYFYRILPTIGGLLSDRTAYKYLPNSVAGFYSFGELLAVLDRNGFQVGRTKKFLFGWCCLIEAVRKPR
jgi:demethylmenaquinone methyltransferase/2-methoxy-6-polyprenyl-1,4-benzoquinol methylase